jgi:hypothetical protein
MLTTMDKAWVGGVVAFIGQVLHAKLGWAFITPELVALVTGALVYWVPNKAAATEPPKPPGWTG